MIVHIVSPLATLDRDIKELRAIRSVVQDLGHSITHDWFEKEYRSISKGKKLLKGNNWDVIYERNMRAIDRCDLLIAESSGYGSFGVGFQIAVAMQKRKPILLLKRGLVPTGVLTDGIHDPHLTQEYYSEDNLKTIVAAFIKKYSLQNKDLRFNFVLDRELNNYLVWRSQKLNKTKAELLRELLIDDIEKHKDLV